MTTRKSHKTTNESNNRRGFLRLLGGGTLAAALIMEGQESHGDTGSTESIDGEETTKISERGLPKLQFRGSSKTGDVEEALKNAVKAAERSVRHPDAMVEWTLKSITGRNGGFAGFNEVTVIIEARVS